MLGSRLVTLALSGAALVVAHGADNLFDAPHEHNKNGTQKGVEMRECSEIAHLTRLSEFVTNTTKLGAYSAAHNLTQLQADDVRAKAMSAQAKLQQLQTNTTLVRMCAVVNADHKLQKQCKQMRKLNKVIEFAQNASSMPGHDNTMNEAKAERLKKKASMARVKLAEMNKNASLIAACQALETGKSTTAGVIQEKKSAAVTAFGTVGPLQAVGSALFVAVMASLLASL